MNKSVPKHIWQGENEAAEFIPYQTHVDEHTIKTHSGDYLQIIRLQGVAHESVAPEQVLLWKEQLNLLLRNIASPDVCIWTHLVRREHKVLPQGEFKCQFDKKLNDKYAARWFNGRGMSREAHVPFCEGLLGKFQRSTLLTFKEDDCKIYADDGAKNLATIRRKILNLVKSHSSKDSVAGKMQRACWDMNFRAEILFGE